MRVSACRARSQWQTRFRKEVMKGIALWLLGIPLPIILILYLFGVM
jgi:hypothetical protein